MEDNRPGLEAALVALANLRSIYSADEAVVWMETPHPLLQGDTPAQRIQKDHLADVIALVEQLKSGAFV